MVKILLISHKFFPDIGGIESVSEMLSNSFYKAGYTIKVLTWTSESGSKEFPYEIIRNPDVYRIIKCLKWADVVFENNPCLRLSWPIIFFKKPHITALHTWITRATGRKSVVDDLKLTWLKRSDYITACSTAMKNYCYPKAIVVTNPYDDKAFRRINSIDKTKDIVFLGRLVSDKGAIVLIDAFYKILIDQRKGVPSSIRTLTIIGDGPERSMLEETVTKLGISDKVVFAGSLKGDSLVNVLNQHRCMVIPSLWMEPFGVVALEGMACGCVPIVSEIGGLPDAIGKAGLTFDRGNVDSLVAALYSLFDNPVLEQELRRLADGHLSSHHQNVIAEKYLDLIQKAIAAKSSVSVVHI